MNIEYFEVRTVAGELVAACKYKQDAEIFATLVHPGAIVERVGGKPEKESTHVG